MHNQISVTKTENQLFAFRSPLHLRSALGGMLTLLRFRIPGVLASITPFLLAQIVDQSAQRDPVPL
jgi:hypothetical protein